jgi:hypothetical protein
MDMEAVAERVRTLIEERLVGEEAYPVRGVEVRPRTGFARE